MKEKLGFSDSYSNGDHKSGEQVPDPVKCWWNDCRNMVIGSDSDSHHAVVGEVGQWEEGEKQVPEEFGEVQFKSDHCIYNDAVNYGLD